MGGEGTAVKALCGEHVRPAACHLVPATNRLSHFPEIRKTVFFNKKLQSKHDFCASRLNDRLHKRA